MRHSAKIFLSLLLIVCTMALSCIPVHAAPVALSAAEELCALWAMYSESVGFSQLYTTSGFKNNFSTPYSSTSAANSIDSLYQGYCNYSGRLETLQETVTWIKNNTEIAISNQQTGAFQYSAGVTEFFDKFSTWVLEDVVGVVKDEYTGLFYTTKAWFNNQLVYNPPSHLFLPAIFSSKPTAAALKADGTVITASTYFGAANTNARAVLPCVINGGVFFLTGHSGDVIYFCSAGANNASVSVKTLNLSTGVTGVYYNSALSGQTAAAGILTFTSLAEAATYYLGYSETDGDRIQLRPKDKYNEDALNIPDVAAPDYTGTRVLEGVTSVPWDEALTLPDILAQVLSLALANANVLADDPTAPDPVINPLVPFNLPSFEFNFSGIWHYVVSWIGSIRSGFSFVTSTWSALPYAMVIPIYASAVIVIVIGTFKRFFS